MLKWLGLRPFTDSESIASLITTDKDYNASKEPLNETRALLIFSTSTQQTWLIFSPLRIYCILDDRERENPVLRWSMDLPDVLEAPIKVKEYSAVSGALDIGERKDWLYSKRLFPEQDIKNVVLTAALDQQRRNSDDSVI
jgi:hypothetical protein